MNEFSYDPIYFTGTGYNDLSAFSAHEIEIDNTVYKTAEHAYQALRVIPEAREKIMNARSAVLAWKEGQRCKDLNELLPNYDKNLLMEKIMRAKITQHPDIKNLLLSTKGRDLVKNTAEDYYWGIGADGSGRNELGKLLMKLRDELE